MGNVRVKILCLVFFVISVVLVPTSGGAQKVHISPGAGGSGQADSGPDVAAPKPNLSELQASIPGSYFFENPSAPGIDERFSLQIGESGTWKAQSIYPIGGRTFSGTYKLKNQEIELATDMGFSFSYRIDGNRLVRTGARMFPGTAGEEIWVKSLTGRDSSQ